MPRKRKARADDDVDQNNNNNNNNNDDTGSEEDPHPSKRFAALKPRVRHVTEHTIKSKWTTLPEPAQERVRELFRAVEMPVLTRQRDDRKRIETQTALGAVRNKYAHTHTLSLC